MIIDKIKQRLDELKNLIAQLDESQYTLKHSILSEASIGQHLRHIIEVFDALFTGYDLGMVNYDNRERNISIEENKNYAMKRIDEIGSKLLLEDKRIFITENNQFFETSYYRELLFNLDHRIHHQALIKVAIITMNEVEISKDFGVAYSTIDFRNKQKV